MLVQLTEKKITLTVYKAYAVQVEMENKHWELSGKFSNLKKFYGACTRDPFPN